MEIYIATPTIELIIELKERFNSKPHVLLSYAFADRGFTPFLIGHRNRMGKLMLNSGAYSEVRGTTKIDLDSYGAFLKTCGGLFDYCVNLDVDPENYDIRLWNLGHLSKLVPNVLPVIHDPYSGEIDQLYDMGYHYLLLGSTYGNDRKQLKFIFDRYYYSGKYPGIRFHKLGTATYATLVAHPYFSSDSSIFAHKAAYGLIMYWNPNREPDADGNHTDSIYFGSFIPPDSMRNYGWRNYHYIGPFKDYLWTNFEYRLTDLMGPSSSFQRQVVNAKFMLDMQDRLALLYRSGGY